LANRLNVDPDGPDDVLQTFPDAATESLPRSAQCDGGLRDIHGETVPNENRGFGSNRTVTPPANVTAANAENANAGVTALASHSWETEL
jgi:hypothetical protein